MRATTFITSIMRATSALRRRAAGWTRSAPPGARRAGLSVRHAGHALYYRDRAGHVAYEVAGGGIDTAIAAISFTLGAHVENLQANDIGGKEALVLAGPPPDDRN